MIFSTSSKNLEKLIVGLLLLRNKATHKPSGVLSLDSLESSSDKFPVIIA